MDNVYSFNTGKKVAAAPIDNCFTVGYVGKSTSGIAFCLDKGPDEFSSYQPHILLGGRRRVCRDLKNGVNYHRVDDRGTAFIYRAATRAVVNSKNGNKFFTLAEPDVPKPQTSLVLVHVGIAFKWPANMKVHTGTRGGALIAREGNDYLVEISEGCKLTIFFEDGSVRTFLRNGPALVEGKKLSPMEMLEIRIAETKCLVGEAEQIADVEKRLRAVKLVLAAAANLLHLTRSHNMGHDMRVKLIQELFLKVDPKYLSQVHGMLTAILYQVDPFRIDMLKGASTQKVVKRVVQVSPPAPQVPQITPEERVAIRRAHIDENAENKRRADERKENHREQRRVKKNTEVTAVVKKQGKSKKGKMTQQKAAA